MNPQRNDAKSGLNPPAQGATCPFPRVKTASRLRLALLGAIAFPAVLLADDCRVDVVVDVTNAGAQLAQPTADHPIYYFPFAQGYREMGDLKAAQPPPRPEAVEHLFFKALTADQYRYPTKQTPPTVLLVLQWGYVAPPLARAVVSGAQPLTSDNSDEFAFAFNLVGGDRLRPETGAGVDLDPQRAILTDAARQPRYFVTVTALDFKSALEKKRVLLWTARVSTEAEGLSVADALPTLIAAAGPHFGQATAKPLLFAAPIIRAD